MKDFGGENVGEESDKISRMLKVIHTAMRTEVNKRLNEKNITSSQMDILVFIANEEKCKKEINQVDIERHFSLTNPTVTGLLNRLQEKKFIKRVPSKKDARFNSIVLTKNGKKFIFDCDEEIMNFEKVFAHNLEENEKKELIRLLEKVLKSIYEEDKN